MSVLQLRGQCRCRSRSFGLLQSRFRVSLFCYVLCNFVRRQTTVVNHDISGYCLTYSYAEPNVPLDDAVNCRMGDVALSYRWHWTDIQVMLHCHTGDVELSHRWHWTDIQVTLHCHTGDIELTYRWRCAVTQVTLNWHKVTLNWHTGDIELTYRWHWTDIQVTLHCHMGDVELIMHVTVRWLWPSQCNIQELAWLIDQRWCTLSTIQFWFLPRPISVTDYVRKGVKPKFLNCCRNRSYLTDRNLRAFRQSTRRLQASFYCSFQWQCCRMASRWRMSRRQDCVRTCFSRTSMIQLATQHFTKDVPAKRM